MGKCKFKSDWLNKSDETGRKISTWGKQSLEGDELMFCCVCNKHFNVMKGMQSVNQHAKTSIHSQNIRIKLDVHQLKLTNNNLQLISNKEAASRAELIWCLKNVQSNWSAASTEGITEVFKTMFVNVPEGFSMSYTKLSYLITEALGPYCRKQLIEDVNNFYSIQYDETTNSKGAKELQIAIRYWSKSDNKIVTRYLESFFLGSATGDILKGFIIESIDNANLPLKNLLMLGSDGPNVNKRVFTLINEDLKTLRGKSLINIGTCSIHLVHNAFLKGLECFDLDISNFIISLYYFFKGRPLRLEDFEKVQTKLSLPNHRILKHVATRWLTLGPAAARVLEQFAALSEYFLQFIPKHRPELVKIKHYADVVRYLNNKSLKAELLFVKRSCEYFEKYTATFQKQEPLIHIMYEELKKLCVNLLSKILKSTTTLDFKNVKKLCDNLFVSQNLLPLEKLECGELVKSEINNLPELDKMMFLNQCQKFFIKSSEHILTKSPLILKELKYFCWLDPVRTNNVPSYYIKNVCSILPVNVNVDDVIDEFNMFKLDKDKDKIDSKKVDLFWSCVDTTVYPNLTKIAKICLSLVHGSADVERGFSLSRLVMTDDKTAMSLKMLNNRLYIHDALKRYDNQPEMFPITKELLNMARSASASYKQYLENKKIETKKIEDEKRNVEEENQKMLELKQKQKRIEELEKELNDVTKEKTDAQVTVDKLLSETSKKFQKAIKNKNLSDVRVAHSLLNTALKEREDEKRLNKDISKMQTTILKRKSAVISNLFKKKLKEQ